MDKYNDNIDKCIENKMFEFIMGCLIRAKEFEIAYRLYI